jgi:hypothetical protein
MRTVEFDVKLFDSNVTRVLRNSTIGFNTCDGPILPVIPPVTSKDPDNIVVPLNVDVPVCDNGPTLVNVPDPDMNKDPLTVNDPEMPASPIKFFSKPPLGPGGPTTPLALTITLFCDIDVFILYCGYLIFN